MRWVKWIKLVWEVLGRCIHILGEVARGDWGYVVEVQVIMSGGALEIAPVLNTANKRERERERPYVHAPPKTKVSQMWSLSL